MQIKKQVWQNVTEGFMTPALKDADIVLLSEAKRIRTRRGRGLLRTKQFSKTRLKGLVINWDKSKFKVVEKGSRLYHRSGKAEGWNGVHTPGRGVLWVVGYWLDDPEKKLYCYWVSHFLNSWNPQHVDKYTALRRHIVVDLTLPILESFVRIMNRRTDIHGTLGGGDTNSLKWDGTIAGLKHVDNRGLDRVWSSGDVAVVDIYTTPKTGVGGDLKHEGTGVKQAV